MAKDLSRPGGARPVETFYAPIHQRIREQEKTRGVRPSAAEFVRMLARHPLPPRAVALDAGCGGTLTMSLACAERGAAAVHALDISEANLAQARETRAEHGHPAIRLYRASLLDLPFADETFDFVICSGVAHHTPNPSRGIGEVARVLRRGGRLYLSLYAFANSAFEWSVRALRLAGLAVPFWFLHRTVGRSRTVNNFVLDHMYVPILWLHTAAEVRSLLGSHRLAIREEVPSQIDPFVGWGRLGRIVSGDGLMRIWLCEKR